MARYTKTEKITINGLSFETPEIPKKDTVQNHDLPKRKQKWKRFDFKEEEYEKWSNSQKQKFVLEEFRRILFGHWFFNNGVLTYLTGIHYFYLQWFVMDDGNYPGYRDTDKRFFYFWRAIEMLIWCLGMIYTKYRRQGASARGSAISLYYAITETNIINGTISKTGQDSKDIFQLMIVNGLSNLPSFLKPRTSGFDRASKEVIFMKQSERIKKDAPISGSPEGLNNRINWLPTALNSYDGRAIRFLFLDEGAKWKETSVKEYWPIAQKCLTKGSRRVGLAYLPSTINEMEKGGGKEFHEIWLQSDHLSPNFDGETPSGLVKFFIPAYDGFEGYIGEFGESIIETPTAQQKEYLDSLAGTMYACPNSSIGAREFLEKKRDRLKADPEGLAAEKRQNPFTEQEAFRTNGQKSHFPTELLYSQKERIEAGEGPFVRRVTFYRKSDGTVDWIDDPTGNWQLIWDFNNKSEANRHYFAYNKKTPGNVAKFGMGGDPFSHTITLGKGSKGVFYVRKKYDLLDQANSDMFIVRYSGRPKLKSIFFDHAAMTAEYFGCKIGWEEINDEFYEWFLEHGLEGYLLTTPEFMLTQTHRKKRKIGIPATGEKAIETHLGMMVEDVVQNHQKYWFVELIDDYIDFDVTDRTKFDDTMAAGYTIITCSEVNNQRVTEPVKAGSVIKTYTIR